MFWATNGTKSNNLMTLERSVQFWQVLSVWWILISFLKQIILAKYKDSNEQIDLKRNEFVIANKKTLRPHYKKPISIIISISHQFTKTA